jgi:hypothetical protein
VPRWAAPLFVALSVGLATGCRSEETVVPPARAAAPQSAELGWSEPFPPVGPALVFRVHRVTVTQHGWEADVEIENRTDVEWEIGTDRVAVAQSFGVMLFETGDLDEVERRGRDGNLPGLRAVDRFDPPVPPRLVPGRRWRTTIAARGRLAAGRYLRVVFGPLVARAEPPEGMAGQFVWITDHAYRLRR